MPPLQPQDQAQPVTPPQISSPLPSEASHHKLKLISIGLLGLALCGGGIFSYFKYTKQHTVQGNIQTQPATLSIASYFPSLYNRSIKIDPIDEKFLWLLGQNSVMQLDTTSKEVVDYTRQIPGLENKTFTDFARVGNMLCISYQGGIVIYNLDTKVSKQYSTANGLVSNANIKITADPSDTDVLWLSTFGGLTKFTISTGTSQNFTTEIGIAGGLLQPRVFHVDDTYVWLTIVADAETSGGVARLNKKTGVWKAWNNIFFTKGNTPDRFDSFTQAADSETAIVEDDNILYRYDSTKDNWVLLVAKFTVPNPIQNQLVLVGDKAYYWKDGIQELDIDTGKETLFAQPELFSPISSPAITFDQAHSKIIVYGYDVQSDSKISTISLATKKIDSVSFQDLKTPFKAFNVWLSDAKENHVILTGENNLLDYDLGKDAIRTLFADRVNVAKIVGNDVVALNLILSEMQYSNPNTRIATTSIISLETGKVTVSATIKGNDWNSLYHIGDTLNDIYLMKDGVQPMNQAYRLNVSSSSFALVDLDFPHDWKPESIYGDTFATSTHYTYGSHSAIFQHSQEGNILTIFSKEFHLVEGSKELPEVVQVPVGPAKYDYWLGNVSVGVRASVADPKDGNILWIATDRGLIRFNIETKQFYVFTTENGLAGDDCLRIQVLEDNLVIQHPNGLYVYKY